MAKRIFDISREFGVDPKMVLAKAKVLGIVQAKVVSSLLDESGTVLLEEELLKASSEQMKPSLENRRIVKALAGIAWESTLKHRVYSCPDTSDFNFTCGATALILVNRASGARVPLEVCYVTKVAAIGGGFEGLNGLAEPFRVRADRYLSEVGNNDQIIRPGCSHRLYFLSTEPWPRAMLAPTATISDMEWDAILSICTDPDQFLQWPKVGALLWQGCVRTQNDGEHDFPRDLVISLGGLGLEPDTRTNGPAINSFLASGGIRPSWGDEGWPIHHIFDGTEGAPHAVRDGNLFTHSAGLVAAHPVAHHLAHQSVLLKWLLRREAFLRFGFDPSRDFVDA